MLLAASCTYTCSSPSSSPLGNTGTTEFTNRTTYYTVKITKLNTSLQVAVSMGACIIDFWNFFIFRFHIT